MKQKKKDEKDQERHFFLVRVYSLLLLLPFPASQREAGFISSSFRTRSIHFRTQQAVWCPQASERSGEAPAAGVSKMKCACCLTGKMLLRIPSSQCSLKGRIEMWK